MPSQKLLFESSVKKKTLFPSWEKEEIRGGIAFIAKPSDKILIQFFDKDLVGMFYFLSFVSFSYALPFSFSFSSFVSFSSPIISFSFLLLLSMLSFNIGSDFLAEGYLDLTLLAALYRGPPLLLQSKMIVLDRSL